MTTVGVIGAGTMGAGIAQVALEAGDEVVLHDVDAVALDRARERVRDGLRRRASKVVDAPDAIDAWISVRLDRLRLADTLDAVAAEAGLIVEAAIEDLALKQAIFRTLDAAAPDDLTLATNTSALSVTAIASAAGRPQRVLGLHFFNPVPVMELVEVVVTDRTDPDVVRRAEATMAAWGKTTVRCADSPGFIVNRVNRPFTIEALRMLEAGTASVEVIDTAIRDAGYPIGPFELMDLAGLDVNLAAATAVWEGLGRPDRLRPSPIQAALVAEGRLGRKTGRGFYHYHDGRRGPAEPVAPASPDRAPSSAVDIVARIETAITAEAVRMAADGIAASADIALALRLGAGHPRSPFADRDDGDGKASGRATIGS